MGEKSGYPLDGSAGFHCNLPYFGAEQPADIYFMSAMTVNCFGFVDLAGTCSVNSDNMQEYRHLLKAYVVRVNW